MRSVALIIFGAILSTTAMAREDRLIHVAVYKGPASCRDCSEAAKLAIEKSGPEYRVDFVGAGEKIDITAATLARYDIYVQPGGGQDIDGAFRSLGPARVKALRDYVTHGGRYLGLCMGAYLADASHLNLVSQDLDSEVGRSGFPVETIEDAAVDVHWLGRQTRIFYQDGPWLESDTANPGFRSIATYANGDLAVARYTMGNGVVVLSGPHPEAGANWFEDADIPVEKMPRENLVKDLLKQLD